MNQPATFWIEFIGDRSVRARLDETILEASLKAGIPHYHACGGNGECSTCRILVHEGLENLSPPSVKERQLSQSLSFEPNVRLACQTYPRGAPISVHRMIRDEEDINLYITNDLQTDLEYTGRERELALFFLDIRDFTPFLEGFLPFDVIHVLRRLFGLFRNSIEGNGGTIIETAGDGLYAVFGFETDLATAARQAYEAGKTLLDELQLFNENYLERHFNHRLQVGIGLHAGKTIVGNIGIGVNNSPTVMGLPVNIASRIQSATKTLNNSFVVSETVYNYLQPAPEAISTTVMLRGIREPCRVFLCGSPYRNPENSFSQKVAY